MSIKITKLLKNLWKKNMFSWIITRAACDFSSSQTWNPELQCLSCIVYDLRADSRQTMYSSLHTIKYKTYLAFWELCIVPMCYRSSDKGICTVGYCVNELQETSLRHLHGWSLKWCNKSLENIHTMYQTWLLASLPYILTNKVGRLGQGRLSCGHRKVWVAIAVFGTGKQQLNPIHNIN